MNKKLREKYDRPTSDEYSGDVKATLSRFDMCSVKLFGPIMSSVIESMAKFIFRSSVISRSNWSSLSHVQANNQSWMGDRNIFCVKISVDFR